MNFINNEEDNNVQEDNAVENNNLVEFSTDEEDTSNLVEITKEETTPEPVEKSELEFNKKNREDYEKLMEESSTNKDGYWDSNNIFVKLLLLILGIIIICGVVYYVFAFMGGK